MDCNIIIAPLLQGINKRFQRLESHVVTLARSVAHLSSEMRTQHLMMQVMYPSYESSSLQNNQCVFELQLLKTVVIDD